MILILKAERVAGCGCVLVRRSPCLAYQGLQVYSPTGIGSHTRPHSCVSRTIYLQVYGFAWCWWTSDGSVVHVWVQTGGCRGRLPSFLNTGAFLFPVQDDMEARVRILSVSRGDTKVQRDVVSFPGCPALGDMESAGLGSPRPPSGSVPSTDTVSLENPFPTPDLRVPLDTGKGGVSWRLSLGSGTVN